MSRRLLSTSCAFPGFVRRTTSHLVHPRGAASRTASSAALRAAGVAARSSSSAATRTSAAAPRSASLYRRRVAALAFATHMPLNPPRPTPCTSRKHAMPLSSAASSSSRPITRCIPRASSRVSSISIASTAVVASCSSRHCCHRSRVALSSPCAARAASPITARSSGVRASTTARVVSSGSSSSSMSSTVSSVPATLAPPSWCIRWLSSWIACSTARVPRTGSVAPVRRIATIPGRPSRGFVRLPASAALALPTARKKSHCPLPRSSRLRSSAASSSVRTLSASTAPSATSPSYALRAARYRRRHSSRSALRRAAPAVERSTTALNALSTVGALPNTPAQSSVWNTLCVSGYSRCPSHTRSPLRQNSILLCSRTCRSSAPPSVAAPRSFTLLTRPFIASSMASSLRAAAPCCRCAAASAATACATSASSSARYASHSCLSMGRICASRCSSAPSSSSSLAAVPSSSRSCSELCPLVARASTAASLASPSTPVCRPSAPAPTTASARSYVVASTSQWSMAVVPPSPPAKYVVSTSPTLARLYSYMYCCSHASYSLPPFAPTTLSARAVCACRSPATTSVSPAASASSAARRICARVSSRRASPSAVGDPLRAGTYACSIVSSVPSASTRSRARCTRPGTISSTSSMATFAASCQIITPAPASPSAAGEWCNRQPSCTPVVSSARSCPCSSCCAAPTCVSCTTTMSLSAASVCIVRYSRPSACHTSAAVSSASSVPAARRRAALAATASRSRTTTPP